MPGARLLLTVFLLWSLLPAWSSAQDLSAYKAARQVPLSPAQRRIAASLRLAAQIAMSHRSRPADAMLARTLRLHPDGTIGVYIYVDRLTPVVLQTLQHHGVAMRQSHPEAGMVYASVAADDLESIAALPFVRWIRSPLPGTLRTGDVTSVGDTLLRAAEARDTFDVDGSGVRVGIVSDSLINLQNSVASGNLPPPPDVIILDDGSTSPSRTDEGRAVAEIIHDLAPGATLLFHSGFADGSTMAQAIGTLVVNGTDVIMDDIGFFDEPVFEDGMVAQAVRSALNNGVIYVTAAGNDADRHYRGMFTEFVDGDPNTRLHDFGGGDPTLEFNLRPGRTMLAVLQWPDPFDGSANTADYDLLVFDASGNALFDANDPDGACTQMFENVSGICAGIDDQTNTQAKPLEIVQVSNNSNTEVTLSLLINQVSDGVRLLDIHFNREAIKLEYVVPDRSLFGHPCVDGALAVGAIDANQPGFNTIEPFSSHGPCEIFFPARESRPKPDLVAADGVRTSLPGFDPFFGTSAAAPHVAAIAALLIDAAGGSGAVDNVRVAETLRQNAVDLGDAGFDPIYGAGTVDAVEAIAALLATLPPKQGGGSGGGGCSILPTALSPALPLWEAVGNIFLPLMVILAVRVWRGYGSKTRGPRQGL